MLRPDALLVHQLFKLNDKSLPIVIVQNGCDTFRQAHRDADQHRVVLVHVHSSAGTTLELVD